MSFFVHKSNQSMYLFTFLVAKYRALMRHQNNVSLGLHLLFIMTSPLSWTYRRSSGWRCFIWQSSKKKKKIRFIYFFVHCSIVTKWPILASPTLQCILTYSAIIARRSLYEHACACYCTGRAKGGLAYLLKGRPQKCRLFFGTVIAYFKNLLAEFSNRFCSFCIVLNVTSRCKKKKVLITGV